MSRSEANVGPVMSAANLGPDDRPPPAKFASIQLLRAVAALMVVVFHSGIMFGAEDKARLFWWPGVSDHGYLGVLLFFVLSGFITAHILSRPANTTSVFLWHRFWKIYPLYWLVMLYGIYCYFDRNWYAQAFESLGIEGMIASFLILPLKEHPFWEPGWTLEHEILFYVIAALLYPLIRLRGLAVLLIALGCFGIIYAHIPQVNR